MVNVKLRSEYSFREVYGPIEKVIAATSGPAGLCDRFGTWGHVTFYNEMKKANRKALLGVELAVVENATLKEKQPANFMSLIARSDKGLREIYELVSLSTDAANYYYTPRIDYGHLMDLSTDVAILSGAFPVWGSLPTSRKNLFVELSPISQPKAIEWAKGKKVPLIATSDNYYPQPLDKVAYEVIGGSGHSYAMGRTSAMHILQAWEWKSLWPNTEIALLNALRLADECEVHIPQATIPHFTSFAPLEELCRKGAKEKGIDLRKKVYAQRLKMELDLIQEKEFSDYFYLVWDMISYAKQHMLVGPARGSSCGSLVCYLLSITEIDPIPYDLLFERFIDINRKDLPDIDIDFQDDRRHLVFEYLYRKYGQENVARLGTVMRYKAKSAITDVAKTMEIPAYEVNELKDQIIERSSGDARSAFCIMDTFNDLQIARDVIERYPALKVAGLIENHARSSGQHAAGIVVCAEPIRSYCSVDQRSGAAQVDKKDAEKINLLKIDALGLRTLSVIQDCLDQVGFSRAQLLSVPLDYQPAFDLLNSKKFSGIFQFEGYALQSLTGQMTMENFEDIAAMTALARPGPLESGGASEYIKRRTGEHETVHLHPLIADCTKLTYGIVIYQEQVMQIARRMGKLSWEDVSTLRKAMSKSMGKEFFDGFWARFREGAMKQGVKEDDALATWNNINTMGSWSFNRSHAVAYGMVSYWTMYLKAKHPLEFAAACLRNAASEDQGIKLLRELKREGYDYTPFDAKLSQKNWSVQKGVLVGGLVSVKGIGDKSADDILARRKAGQPLTAGQRNKIANAETPYDHVFEAEDLWGHIRREPEKYNITTPITDCASITEEDEGEFLIMGKIKEKDVRDLNDLNAVKKRNGKRLAGQSMTLKLVVEDDTDILRVRIDRHDYIRMALPLIEGAKIGDWYLWKGDISRGFRSMRVKRCRRLTGSDMDLRAQK